MHKLPKLATLMDGAEEDVLAYMGLRPLLPQTVHQTVCRFQQIGADSYTNTATSCIPRTPSNA